MSAQENTRLTSTPSRMLLIRNLHKRCENCHAPGEYSQRDWVKDGYRDYQIKEMLAINPALEAKAPWYRRGWKEVWVEGTDPKKGQPVGEACPCCGAKRPAPKRLRTIKIFGRMF